MKGVDASLVSAHACALAKRMLTARSGRRRLHLPGAMKETQ
jgi:hypothetical protein